MGSIAGGVAAVHVFQGFREKLNNHEAPSFLTQSTESIA
jgi:hypothetical protein